MHSVCKYRVVKIEGVVPIDLVPREDKRGVLIELFRSGGEVLPVQWNAVRSRPNVLRGVHVHVHHADYLTVPMGLLIVGLRDLRVDSPTYGSVDMLEVDDGTALVIPPGVAHGFYNPEPTLHIYGLTAAWDRSMDDLGCRYDDPELALDWPCTAPIISARDEGLGTLRELEATLSSRRAFA